MPARAASRERFGCAPLRDTWPVRTHEQTALSAIELTRGAFASANSGDYDEMMRFYGPDSVWDVSPWGLGTHTGMTAIRQFFKDWIGGFDEYLVTVEQLHDLGNGVVYAIAVQQGRAAGSDGHLRLRYAPVFLWDGDIAIRVTHHRDIEQGRAAGERLAASRG